VYLVTLSAAQCVGHVRHTEGDKNNPVKPFSQQPQKKLKKKILKVDTIRISMSKNCSKAAKT